MTWEDEFRRRMTKFEKSSPTRSDGFPLSIKIRASGGCFHRQHSPFAYQKIDEYLRANPPDNFSFEEHESGPELLVYLSLVTAGLSLTANVINLVIAIIKARTEGIKHGDHPSEPIELIIRGFDEDGKLKEERILRIDSWHDVNEDLIASALRSSTNNMLPKSKGKKKRKI